jgi:hypothetical protein
MNLLLLSLSSTSQPSQVLVDASSGFVGKYHNWVEVAEKVKTH